MVAIRNISQRECTVEVFSRASLSFRQAGGGIILDGHKVKSGQDTEYGMTSGLLHAFATHKPVVFTPDDLHLILLQGMSLYMQKFSEDFRTLLPYLPSDGQKDLLLRVPSLPTSGELDKWATIPQEFANLLSQDLGADKQASKQFIEDVTANYSTSNGELDKIIRQVTLLGIFSPFYKYYAISLCGIPSFVLQGTVEDWKNLFDLPSKIVKFFGLDPEQLLANDKTDKAKFSDQNRLGQFCIWLMRVQDDVLRYFYFARNNQLTPAGDYNPTDFWENFYKYHDAQQRSGSTPGVNGRTLILFPIFSETPTTYRINNVILVNRDIYNQFLVGKTRSIVPDLLPKNVTHCTIEYIDLSQSPPRQSSVQFQAGFFKYRDPSGGTLGPGPISFPRELKISVRGIEGYVRNKDEESNTSASSSSTCTLS